MSIRTHFARQPRDGAALVISMVLLTVLMTITFAFFATSSQRSQRVGDVHDDRRALILAESGLNEAYAAIRSDTGTGAIGTQDDPVYLGGGIFWVEATPTANPNETQLRSVAAIGSGRAVLGAVVTYEPSANPLFNSTINSKDTLTLNADVVIDSFDSSVGDYTSQATNAYNTIPYANQNGHARSNNDIIINSRAILMGDAIPGPGHVVSMVPTSFVSGSTTPAAEPFSFPSIGLPTHAVSGSIMLPNNTTKTLPAGNYEVSNLEIGKGATLTVEGPATILVDSFLGNPSGALEIDATNGPVTIQVRETYDHLRLFEVKAKEVSAGKFSPLAVAFMYEGPNDIVFPSNTNIRGAYYAPNADILFASGNEAWGAFAGNKITMSNGMKFHFDEELMKHWDADEFSKVDPLTVEAWGITVFDNNDDFERSLMGDRRDPLSIYGTVKEKLAKPSEAWEVVAP